MRIGPASLSLLPPIIIAAGGDRALAAPSDLEYAPIPAEVSLMKSGGEYSFQNDLGNSFYVFDEDEKTKSHCTDTCTKAWAPVLAPKDAKPLGDWTLVERKPGQKQWAYKGHPIYTSVGENAGAMAPNLEKEIHWHKLVP
jgi:predicted lipoprotein with Yx(FWY)xxD motif